MNTLSLRRKALVAAIAGTLVLAACGGDDDDSSSDTTEAAGAASTAPAATTETSDAGVATTEGGTDSTEPESTEVETTDGGSDGTSAPMEPVSGTLIGAGASSQAAAMQAWQAGFQEANPDATVEYDPVGSGGGRETFLAGGSDFAGSDAYMDDEDYAASIERCAGDQGAINLPHYISPIVVAYNLPDVPELNLSPATHRRDLLRRDHHVERRRDRRRQPRCGVAGHGDQPGAPLGRVGHDAELHPVPQHRRPRRVDERAGPGVAGRRR